MNPTLLVLVVAIVGVIGNRSIRRLNPTVSKQQIFCAIAAWVGGTLLVVGRATHSFWWNTGLFIAVVMGTFLIMAWMEPRSTPPGPV